MSILVPRCRVVLHCCGSRLADEYVCLEHAFGHAPALLQEAECKGSVSRHRHCVICEQAQHLTEYWILTVSEDILLGASM